MFRCHRRSAFRTGRRFRTCRVCGQGTDSAMVALHMEQWGYTVTEIHGGMNPHERKRAQEDFRTSKQICVATEAAGEGINLQFCRLMINYDLPWNPTRLDGFCRVLR